MRVGPNQTSPDRYSPGFSKYQRAKLAAVETESASLTWHRKPPCAKQRAGLCVIVATLLVLRRRKRGSAFPVAVCFPICAMVKTSYVAYGHGSLNRNHSTSRIEDCTCESTATLWALITFLSRSLETITSHLVSQTSVHSAFHLTQNPQRTHSGPSVHQSGLKQ